MAGVVGHVLGGAQFAQGFAHVTGNGVVVNFHGFDHAIGVDDESAAQCQTSFFNVYAKSARKLVGGVANQRELGFAHGRRCLVPHFVGEMGVGGDDVHLGTGLLELGVAVGRVFHFSGAVKRKCGWHKDHNRPFAFHAFIGHGHELTVVESLVFEWDDLGID